MDGKHIAYLIAVSCVGIAVVVGGIFAPSIPLQLFLTSTGGAVAGAGISSVFGWAFTRDLDIEIRRIIKEGFKNNLALNEDKVSHFRKKWHMYHVTSMNRTFIWRHQIIDFSKNVAVGKFVGETITPGKAGEPNMYTYEGFIKPQGGRLILCATRVIGDEPTSVYLFPHFTNTLLYEHCGILIHKTWDSPESFSPCILTEKALFDTENTLGSLDEIVGEKLDSLWKDRVEHTLLPRIYQTEA